ncbi:cytochrome c1 protein [Ideonella sp. DXS29W]|uniref:Cytochrome c1 protein n=1 Tax=Ideonella lacteola TaxID=2984193 RepID=A0ABU9BNA3_9BURK
MTHHRSLDLGQARLWQRATRAGRRAWIGAWAAACALAATALVPSAAQAVPSYARQTGSDCAACHVGSFGPQLTPFGIQFKLGGYTDSDGKDGKVPLSAMLVANHTHTSKDAAEAPERFSANDNTALQELSGFIAGRFGDHVGAFVQYTYSDVDRASAMDQIDLRFATPVQFGDKEATVGLSLNTNPTLTDPFNTIGQWRFPYTESDFGYGTGPGPLVEGLASSVIGVNGYMLWDKHWYGELGLYNTLSPSMLNHFNADDVGSFKGLGTYWRLGYMMDRKRDNFSFGLVGFDAKLRPDRSAPLSDHYRDLGVDAAYQWLGNREHIFSVNASYIREWQTLDQTLAGGGASHASNSLNQARVAASYTYDQTWGVTAGLFNTRSSQDSVLNASALNGRSDTAGYMLQADWTPWGKEGSWAAPWANLRLGLQYTGYSRYQGGSRYLDDAGLERRARDNNTLMAFAWVLF